MVVQGGSGVVRGDFVVVQRWFEGGSLVVQSGSVVTRWWLDGSLRVAQCWSEVAWWWSSKGPVIVQRFEKDKLKLFQKIFSA
jgi:hypothetical protein